MAQGLSCPVSRAIFLDQGSNPCPMLSSALASRFLTTEPLGKPQYCPTTPKLISLSGTQFSTKKHFSNALNLKHKSIHSGLPLLMCIELFFLYELIRKIIWICFVIHASLKLYSHWFHWVLNFNRSSRTQFLFSPQSSSLSALVFRVKMTVISVLKWTLSVQNIWFPVSLPF